MSLSKSKQANRMKRQLSSSERLRGFPVQEDEVEGGGSGVRLPGNGNGNKSNNSARFKRFENSRGNPTTSRHQHDAINQSNDWCMTNSMPTLKLFDITKHQQLKCPHCQSDLEFRIDGYNHNADHTNNLAPFDQNRGAGQPTASTSASVGQGPASAAAAVATTSGRRHNFGFLLQNAENSSNGPNQRNCNHHSINHNHHQQESAQERNSNHSMQQLNVGCGHRSMPGDLFINSEDPYGVINTKYFGIYNQADQLLQYLRKLPAGVDEWRDHFETTYELHRRLWNFQLDYMLLLGSNYGLKRWPIDEVESIIAKLYYCYHCQAIAYSESDSSVKL